MLVQYPWMASGLAAGDHICGIYETEEEYREIVRAFLRRSLCLGERVLYVTDAHTPAMVQECLAGLLREPVEAYVKRGQLVFLPPEAYLNAEGHFDPAAVVARLDEEAQQALAAGFTGLSATGEMTWAWRYGITMEQLYDYERRLHQAAAGRRWIALCQYSRQAFSSEMLQPLLAFHHVNVIGLVGYDHYYYSVARLPMPRTLPPSRADLYSRV